MPRLNEAQWPSICEPRLQARVRQDHSPRRDWSKGVQLTYCQDGSNALNDHAEQADSKTAPCSLPVALPKHIADRVQGRVRPANHQQSGRAHLQPQLQSRSAEAQQQRLLDPGGHLPWHPCYIALFVPCASSTYPARLESAPDNGHTISRIVALPPDLLSDADGCQNLAIHQPGAAEYRHGG